jgi:hypothetical protein
MYDIDMYVMCNMYDMNIKNIYDFLIERMNEIVYELDFLFED